jgi:hypothetical protein
LKALVDEGCNFLPSPTDPILLYKTHSLRWLAQIVCQIVKTIQWEIEFKSEGIASLSEFSALSTNSKPWTRCRARSIPIAVVVMARCRISFSRPNVVRLAKRLDGLLDLLDATTDAVAATWNQMSDEEPFHAGGDFKPTIQ